MIASRKIGMTVVATVLLLMSFTIPAAAATYGAYSQVGCRVYASTTVCTTGSIIPHSSDHWLRTKINCIDHNATYDLYDTVTGVRVANGSCSNGSSSAWKTTYGLYGEYYLVVRGTWAWGHVANCTSHCTTHNEYS